jgi:hypothetical protein
LRIAGFAKKERRLAVRVKTHFPGMRGIVAAHTIHTTHRKKTVTVGYWQRMDGWGLKHIVH